MGITNFEKGTVILKEGDNILNLYLIVKGTVSASCCFGSVILGAGSMIGMFEDPIDSCRFTYTALENTTVSVSGYWDREEITTIAEENPKLSLTISSVSVKDFMNLHELYHNSASTIQDSFYAIKGEYIEYLDLCRSNGISPKKFPVIDLLEEPDTKSVIRSWQLSYMTALSNNDASMKKYFYSADIALCLGTTRLAAELTNDLSLDLFLLGEYYRNFETNTAEFAAEYEKLSETVSEKQNSHDGEPLRNVLSAICAYSGLNCSEFKACTEEFLNAPDRLSSSEEMRQLRKKLTENFYKVYKAVFLKSLEDPRLPVEINLFLTFGLCDERLVSASTLEDLMECAEKWQNTPDNVFTIPEWLKQIYEMNINPSRSEFDLDYFQDLRHKVKGGYLSKAQAAELSNDRDKRLYYEIQNMFTIGNRLTHGRLSTFVPLLYEEAISIPLKNSLVEPSRLMNEINKIRQIDYTCFYRDVLASYPELDISQIHISKEILPCFILMPNSGSYAGLWQEIDGSRRDTPARIILSIFHTEKLQDSITKAIGSYRWEICKRIQGVHWNDVTEPSLTSFYADYLQFYRKNSALSAQVREKVRNSIQKGRNNFKNVFTMDYYEYINYESNGALRLNKVSRSILFRFCPFSSDVRARISTNPQYKDLMEKYQIFQSRKKRTLELLIRKIESQGKQIPHELKQQLDYISL